MAPNVHINALSGRVIAYLHLDAIATLILSIDPMVEEAGIGYKRLCYAPDLQAGRATWSLMTWGISA
jgi:hypothetical protein